MQYSQEDIFFMEEALKEAEKAYQKDEVPIGAIVVYQGQIIGRGHNLRETKKDPTAHAEIIALRQAGQNLKTWNLSECLLYVTVEPCPMCAGALINARIKKLFYGVDEDKFGSAGSQINLLQLPFFNHNVLIRPQLLEKECRKILQEFFQKKR